MTKPPKFLPHLSTSWIEVGESFRQGLLNIFADAVRGFLEELLRTEASVLDIGRISDFFDEIAGTVRDERAMRIIGKIVSDASNANTLSI